MIKILSTPTAKTRKGRISNMIKVAGTFTYPNRPTDALTEMRTSTTPVSDKLNFPSMKNLFQLKVKKELDEL